MQLDGERGEGGPPARGSLPGSRVRALFQDNPGVWGCLLNQLQTHWASDMRLHGFLHFGHSPPLLKEKTPRMSCLRPPVVHRREEGRPSRPAPSLGQELPATSGPLRALLCSLCGPSRGCAVTSVDTNRRMD